MRDQVGTSLKHSRLCLHSALQRCNSLTTDRTKKRKMGDTFFSEMFDTCKKKECPIVFTLMEALKSITKITKDVVKVVDANVNTKKEVKELTQRLKRNVEVIHREPIKSWLGEHRWEKVETPTTGEER